MAPEELTAEAGTATAELQDAIPKLDLDVQIEAKGACERHVRVSVSRKDVDRYFDRVFGDLAKNAVVRGFRPGRAPRKVVESKYRKEASEQVKSGLLVDSLTQLTESQQLAAIGEPDFNPNDIAIPAVGPLVFEFNIEVRPDFELPKWKGLEIERPVREVVDADIDERIAQSLEKYILPQKVDRPAALEDRVALEFETFDGERRLAGFEDSVRVRSTLRFADGNLNDFDKLVVGAAVGDQREAVVKLSDELADEALRGKEVTVKFKVKGIEEIDPKHLESSIGDDATVRDTVRNALVRQLSYEQQQRVRKQILASLTGTTQIELPPDLLRKQSRRELDRSVLELQRSGFTLEQIKEHEATLRQNVLTETGRALREHFVLERIAEEEKIEAEAEDYEREIMLLAAQNNISPRMVRAKIDQANQMDALRNQIVERKVLERITAEAQIKELPFEFPKLNSSAVSHALAGGVSGEAPAEASAAG